MAQRSSGNNGFDTAYVRDFSHILTARIYSSTKDNSLRLGALPGNTNLAYLPNNRINLGVGASYHALTLNIGFPIPGINDDDAIRGPTRYLDAQANILTKRTATNLFLQGFSGYYVNSHDHAAVNWPTTYERPYRPDVRQFNAGASIVRIVNSDRFSYRASFNQDAWQRRSAGSWLVGGYATWFTMRGDSSLVPTAIRDSFTAAMHMERGTFTDLGPMGGYVHTLVVHEHFFLTLSTVCGVGISTQRMVQPQVEGRKVHGRVGPGWHAQVRAGAGYNGAKYYAGISYNQERIGYLLPEQRGVQWTVSNLRFNLVRRFDMRIPFMDRGIRWFSRKVKEPVEEVLPTIGG
jgi:hypothetical protein